MATSTLAKLEAYAYEHFREDYIRLPAVKIERVKSDYNKLRINDQVDITVSPEKDLLFNPDQLKQLEPFCWINVSFEQHQKTYALLTYYVLVKYPYTDVARIRSSYFTDDFKLACADVANALRVAETAVDDSSDRGNTVAGESQVHEASRTQHLPLPFTQARQPSPFSKWGNTVAFQPQIQDASRTHHFLSPSNVLQPKGRIGEMENRIQEHQNLVQGPIANNNTLKRPADTSKDNLAALENRISTLETQMNWVTQFAVAKVDNEDLKSKLASAEAQMVKLAEENADLRKRIIWLPAPDVKGPR